MAELKKYAELVHSGKSVTLERFAEDHFIDLSGEDFTLEIFYNYEDNSTRIKNSLRKGQKDSGITTLINHGVLIKFPINKVEKTVIDTISNVVVENNDFEAFLDDRIKDIIHDTNYKPVNIDRIKGAGNVWRMKNRISVWIFCKGLGNIGEEGKLINVTPFVKSLTTNVGDTGGNFKIEFAPISASFDSVKGWKIQKAGS